MHGEDLARGSRDIDMQALISRISLGLPPGFPHDVSGRLAGGNPSAGS